MKIVAVIDSDTALGFRLGGIEVIPVRSAAEAASRLSGLASGEGAKKEVGLVLYADEWLNEFPEELRGRIERSEIPIFTPVPTLQSWRETELARDYLAGLLKRTIGYQIRLK